MAITSGANERSGVTISRRAPLWAITSAACSAEWSPASSNSSTSCPGLTSPAKMSQADTTSWLPVASTSVWGSPPVAMMTTSGFSARTAAASAKVLKRNTTPCSSQRAMRQSMMLIISLRRALKAVRRICPPGLGAASSTVTAWPRSDATRAASMPAGPAPTTSTLRRVGAGL